MRGREFERRRGALQVRVGEGAAPTREVVREGASLHKLERQDDVRAVSVREVRLDEERRAQARRDSML